MSGWDSHYGGYSTNMGGAPQGSVGGDFYDGSGGYGNYDNNQGYSQFTQGAVDSVPTFGNDTNYGDEFADEPPLLEELGINLEHIVQKTLSVLNPFRSTRTDVAGDADLAGPLVFCLAFGSLLLLTGKVHFNYIYGIGAMGCLANYGLLSLMSTSTAVSFTVVASVLGYCILPIVILSALSVLVSLTGPIGSILSALAVLWSSLSASKLFVTAFQMEHQQLLVAYPCSMLYAVFALITMF